MRNLIIFMVGTAIGAVMGYLVAKDQFETKAQEEVSEAREALRKIYRTKMADGCEEKEETAETDTQPQEKKHGRYSWGKAEDADYEKVVIDYISKDNEDGGKGVSMRDWYPTLKEVKDVVNVKSDTPYVITPDEFGKLDAYKIIGLTAHTYDEYVEDEFGEIMDEEDVEDLLGSGWRNHIGEYEDDAVHIRNDEYETDYEVLIKDEK